MWYFRIVLILFVHVVGILEAAAEDPYVVIEGVRFECRGCASFEGESCGVPQGGNIVVTPCSEVFDYLLNDTALNSRAIPTTRELFQYLEREKVSDPRVHRIFAIAYERREFAQLSPRELGPILRRYPESVRSLLEGDWGNEEARARLWALVREDRDEKLSQIKAVLIGRMSKVELTEIVRELGHVDITKDVEFLTVALATSQKFATPQRTLLSDLQRFVAGCAPKSETPHHCDLSHQSEILKPARNYLSALYVAHVTSRLNSDAFTVEQKAEILSKVPIDLVPATDIKTISAAGLWTFLNNSSGLNKKLLDRSKLTTLLAVNPTTDGHLLDQVRKLMTRIELNEQQTSEKEELEQALHVLAVKENAKLENRQYSIRIIQFFVIVILAAILLLLVLRRRRELERTIPPDALDSMAQNQELEAILAYFKLPREASADELKKRYRELVRRYHPDSSSADKEKFLELQEKYERALQYFE